ncbi:MAG: hypothetical protein JJT90_01760 [Ectothiorhodospiraceae bacterium]|nr:hypothetical protein [Ectothiorhodospiraceae bacterium]
MNRMLRGAFAAGLLVLGGLGSALAGPAEDTGPGPWSLTAGGAVIAPEGGREGYGVYLNLGWRMPYHSPGAPRSFFALELELMETTDSYRRSHGSRRIEGDLRSAGFYLAANTAMGERSFFRARLGGVYRYLDESHRSARHQGRLGVGLGLGYNLTERLDLITDAGVQYLGLSTRFTYLGTAGLRVRF